MLIVTGAEVDGQSPDHPEAQDDEPECRQRLVWDVLVAVEFDDELSEHEDNGRTDKRMQTEAVGLEVFYKTSK